MDLEKILQIYKERLNIPNTVKTKIIWGKKAKRVLGSVRLVNNISIIRISKFLADEIVPEYVIHEVILHELIHVKTGHGSVLQKSVQHAHRGGVIKKEMESVGALELYHQSNTWLKKNWRNTLQILT